MQRYSIEGVRYGFLGDVPVLPTPIPDQVRQLVQDVAARLRPEDWSDEWWVEGPSDPGRGRGTATYAFKKTNEGFRHENPHGTRYGRQTPFFRRRALLAAQTAYNRRLETEGVRTQRCGMALETTSDSDGIETVLYHVTLVRQADRLTAIARDATSSDPWRRYADCAAKWLRSRGRI